jgi:hypothetical protein
MRHPNEGVLRRLVDEPAGVADADRAHVADCPICLVGLADARNDAAAIGAALRTDSMADVDVDAAWARLTAAQSQNIAAVRTPARRRGWGAALRRPAVAALGFVVVVTGAGVAAANDWLPIFASAEEIEPIAISSDLDLSAVPDLTDYGTLEVTGAEEPSPVADEAAAEAFSGLDVPEVAALPDGVSGEPQYLAIGEVTATFTFSAERAAQAAAEAGEDLPPVPAGLDGAQVRLTAGPAVAAVWAGDSGVPALVVARAGAPEAFASGTDFEELRAYLLSLPGLPEEVAAQLRSFSPDASTLPLPVPADYATSSPVEVNGDEATLLTSRDGFLAGVVWVEDGVVTAVAGSLSGSEVVSIASGLR